MIVCVDLGCCLDMERGCCADVWFVSRVPVLSTGEGNFISTVLQLLFEYLLCAFLFLFHKSCRPHARSSRGIRCGQCGRLRYNAVLRAMRPHARARGWRTTLGRHPAKTPHGSTMPKCRFLMKAPRQGFVSCGEIRCHTSAALRGAYVKMALD